MWHLLSEKGIWMIKSFISKEDPTKRGAYNGPSFTFIIASSLKLTTKTNTIISMIVRIPFNTFLKTSLPSYKTAYKHVLIDADQIWKQALANI